MTGFPCVLNHQHLQWILYLIVFYLGTVTKLCYMCLACCLSLKKQISERWDCTLAEEWSFQFSSSQSYSSLHNFYINKKIPEHDNMWCILLGCDSDAKDKCTNSSSFSSIILTVPNLLLICCADSILFKNRWELRRCLRSFTCTSKEKMQSSYL